MKIVADENMPMVEQLFSSRGDIVLHPGRDIRSEQVFDADILLVRSVTAVNERLLKNSNVRFVGSATIGTDHVDLDYLQREGIAFASAPGCNAEAVMNYVLSGLSYVDTEWPGKTVGIIGCGNVGSRVYAALKTLGVSCRCYDPFLSADQQEALCGFEDALQADILCLHTPLTKGGDFPTWHMFDAGVLDSLNPGTLILNAGRGGAIDNQSLKTALRNRRLSAILDVWENEPGIDPQLLSLVSLGTPHIAGYSLEGRIRGTLMVYGAFCRWLGEPAAADISLADLWEPAGGTAASSIIRPGTAGAIRRQILDAYNPEADGQRLLAGLKSNGNLSEHFDWLRKHYPFRREFRVES